MQMKGRRRPYLLAIAMCVQSVNLCEMITVEMYTILTFLLKWVKVKCKYGNEKAVCDFLFVVK